MLLLLGLLVLAPFVWNIIPAEFDPGKLRRRFVLSFEGVVDAGRPPEELGNAVDRI